MKIFAAIVFYNPLIEKLSDLCACLIANYVKVILVDNSAQSKLRYLELYPKIDIMTPNAKFGIALAQTSGINLAVIKRTYNIGIL